MKKGSFVLAVVSVRRHPRAGRSTWRAHADALRLPGSAPRSTCRAPIECDSDSADSAGRVCVAGADRLRAPASGAARGHCLSGRLACLPSASGAFVSHRRGTAASLCAMSGDLRWVSRVRARQVPGCAFPVLPGSGFSVRCRRRCGADSGDGRIRVARPLAAVQYHSRPCRRTAWRCRRVRGD